MNNVVIKSPQLVREEKNISWQIMKQRNGVKDQKASFCPQASNLGVFDDDCVTRETEEEEKNISRRIFYFMYFLLRIIDRTT